MASVKWSELYRWSLVDVEFGIPKKDIRDDLDCVDMISDHLDSTHKCNIE